MGTPALHPDAEKLLDLIRATGRPPFERLSVAEAREAYAASRAVLQPPPEDVADTRDLSIPGPGGPLALRVYRGAGTPDAAALPALLYLHGGGWVIGGLDSHDGVCRRLANLAACRVVAVDYRLAPEHRFPPPSTTRRRPWPGWPRTRRRSASTPPALRWAATAPGATSRRCSPSWGGTARCR